MYQVSYSSSLGAKGFSYFFFTLAVPKMLVTCGRNCYSNCAICYVHDEQSKSSTQKYHCQLTPESSIKVESNIKEKLPLPEKPGSTLSQNVLQEGDIDQPQKCYVTEISIMIMTKEIMYLHMPAVLISLKLKSRFVPEGFSVLQLTGLFCVHGLFWRLCDKT